MTGAIELVERQAGIIAGIVAIAIEENIVTNAFRKSYKCVSAVTPGSPLQKQCNDQYLESFDTYSPETAFPVSYQSEKANR